MITIPFVSAILYLIGGQWWKPARWVLVGVYIFLVNLFYPHHWWYLFSILSYFIATNVFSYGDNMWTTKLFGRWISMGLSGLAFGLASTVILGVSLGILQSIINLLAFLMLKYLDDSGRLKNPWQELCRGFFGTIVFTIK